MRENKILREENVLLKNWRFGKSSERIEPGQLLIFDEGNNRVKIHTTIPSMDNAPAQVVFGQEDFTGGQENHAKVTARTFRVPSGLDIDGPSLFVTDRLNHRVLGWSVTPEVDNKNADAVFGKPGTRNTHRRSLPSKN